MKKVDARRQALARHEVVVRAHGHQGRTHLGKSLLQLG